MILCFLRRELLRNGAIWRLLFRDLCKLRRIHYGLAKNACSQCSKKRTDTHKVKCRLLCFLGFRLMRYLVVCNFGCLIQILDCLQLLSAIQCLECASMTHFLFISRTIEAYNGTQGSGPQKWESEPILASLSALSLPPVMLQ
jgi:hypothetical protein